MMMYVDVGSVEDDSSFENENERPIWILKVTGITLPTNPTNTRSQTVCNKDRECTQ